MRHTARQRLLLFFVSALLALSPLLVRSARAVEPLSYEPGQIVVRLAEGGQVGLLNSLYGTTTLDTIAGQPDIYLLGAPSGADLPALVALIAGDPGVAYAELNYLTADPESGSTNRIYGWADSNQFKHQNVGSKLALGEVHSYTGGAGTLIAVLDTGLQLDHPEFAGVVSGLGFDFVDGDADPSEEANGLDDDGDGQVDEGYGHGTHVTGIVHLVAPEATLLPLRVLNSDSRGNAFKAAAAIYYAATNGADVINMSLGSAERSIVLGEAVAEAAGMGVVIVTAAGNLGSPEEVYPAAESCAVAVSSVKNENGIKSSFASYGGWVGLAAQGEKITSTVPVNGYASTTGTSMAAPFVAGQAALLRSLDPGLTLGQVGLLLGGTANPASDPNYGWGLGAGVLDILGSLEALVTGAALDPQHNVFAGCSGD